MERVFNFSAGPSGLPLPVLEKAAKELVNYGEAGMSVMEMSHRSKPYMAIFEQTEALFREVMGVPANYKVLFLQGGATSQFTMVPMNLLRTGKADYCDTGEFAKKAIKEAKRYGEINVVMSSADSNYDHVPELDKSKLNPEADYFHYTTNNTIFGTKFSYIPETGNVPLVTDMSSNILSEPCDVSKFGVIYAGAQKNIGPAGVTVVIVREDLLGFTLDKTPQMYDYTLAAKNDSMLNTPPTYGIYIAKLVFEWIKEVGGVEALAKRNYEKAAILYDYLDGSGLFKATVQCKKSRSIMNVTFVTGNAELDDKFIKEAAAAGFVNLKGHRVVGGMRASIYNPMPAEGIAKLVEFMKKFEAANK